MLYNNDNWLKRYIYNVYQAPQPYKSLETKKER